MHTFTAVINHCWQTRPTVWSTSPPMTLAIGMGYVVLGAAISGYVFNKLSHLVEYICNEQFGDYSTLQKTLDGRIIVSIGSQRDNYYAQNIILTVLIVCISSKAIQVLLLAGLPSTVAMPLFFGSLVAPSTMALLNMLTRHFGLHEGRWVQVSDGEVLRRRIDIDHVEWMQWSKRVYCEFGSAPVRMPGYYTDQND